MSEIVFFLEEPSAEALLKTMLPRVLPPETSFRCVVFEGKQDLEKQLVRRMRGYRNPQARFVVLRDQDSADCKTVKHGLRQKCLEAGRPKAIVRIACRELESWYWADLAAVEAALDQKGLRRLQNKRRYQEPDKLQSPSRVLSQLAPSYQKIGGSRAIGPHLALDNPRSRSFAHFITAIRSLAGFGPVPLTAKRPQRTQRNETLSLLPFCALCALCG
ncbi:MAG: DUF4276 family protein [Verrucomicrobiota bacterium]